jgi:UDP-glucose 4-epimerase
MESPQVPRPVILVTGARGLLGLRVVSSLAQNIPDCSIIAAGRSANPVQAPQPGLTVVSGDLREPLFWSGLPDTITHVVHLAAVIPWQAGDRYKSSVVTDNLLPIAHLIEHSQRWPNLRQIIYSSSVAVYGQTHEYLSEESPKRPANLYGAAKLAGEGLLACCETRGIRCVSLRLSSLYAFGQYSGTVLPIMVERARQKQPLLLFGDGSRTQDFLHCEDAARAILLSFQKQTQGVYNVGSGVSVSMADLAHTVARVFGDPTTEIVFQPDKPESDSGLKLNIDKANRELDYRPVIQLESGLRKLKLEFEAHQEEIQSPK